MSSRVLILSGDPHIASALAARLNRRFPKVDTARSIDDLRIEIPKFRTNIVVVDLDLASFDDVKSLHHDLGANVICTHRLPDEFLWAAALQAGALDCCYSDDIESIVAAACGRRVNHAAA